MRRRKGIGCVKGRRMRRAEEDGGGGRRRAKYEKAEEAEKGEGESAGSLRRTVLEYYWLFALVTGQILSFAAWGGYTNGSPRLLIHAPFFLSLCVCKS